MPELPEVETTCAGIRPHLVGARLDNLLIRERRFRWPIEEGLESRVRGQTLHSVQRRAKYILLELERAFLVIHLGMSGSLRVLPDCSLKPGKHDHVDMLFSNGRCLRFCDPRRFGSLLYFDSREMLEQHPLFSHLGPEPLSDAFNVDYLFRMSRRRQQAIKVFIMNASMVVGVGNIYANEALFAAGIHPDRKAGSLSKQRLGRLVDEIKVVLASAIQQGGTSLKDFEKPDGKPGYFSQQLNVYGRKGQACVKCSRVLVETRLGQRSTVFCKSCQR